MRLESLEDARAQAPHVLGWFEALKDVQLRTGAEREHGIFIGEGEVVIRRSIAAGYPLLALLAEPRWLDSLADVITADTVVISERVDRLSQLTGYHVHRGALAAFGRRPLLPVAEILHTANRVLFIEGMVNHTNVGAIFRSAAAMRMDAILVDYQCADPLYRRAIRTSMGTVFQLPWTRATLSEMCQAGDFERIALTPTADAEDIRSIDWGKIDRLMLMIGTEGDGLSEAALEASHRRVVIPMNPGIDSLNAAAAAAVACYEISRGVK
jgi:tRNA G18 (ribose-2'-O)-methylase SpoU